MVNKFKEMARKYTVLYVEDDKDIQKKMQDILSMLFKKVFIADNGQEGYEKYKNEPADFIISDISMPVMNGIEMAKEIRQIDKHIPIILFTAFSDKEYLFDAIHAGIDRYINKPLDQVEFFSTLEDILQRLEDEQMAKAYQQELLEKKINKVALDTLKQTTQIYPNPTFIYKQNRLYFINQAAMKLCQFEKLDDFSEDSPHIETRIVSKEGFLKTFFDYDAVHVEKNRILWQLSSGRNKVFLLYKQNVDDLEIFSLNDITRVEYEKQKSKYLLDYLFETLNKIRSKKTKSTLSTAPKVTQTVKKQEKKEKSDDDIRLESMHGHRTESASEYIQTLEDDLLEEVAEMEELESDLITQVENLQDNFSLEGIQNYGLLINQYAKMVSTLIEFEDLAFSLEKIGTFLSLLEDLEFDKEKLLIFLGSIQEDLKYWRNNIFVNQETLDIHYLDASLLSSCLQIENEFINKIDDSEYDDLEFF